MDRIQHLLFYSFFACLLSLTACSSSKLYMSAFDREQQDADPPSRENLVHQLYLIGDAGSTYTDEPKPALDLLSRFVAESDSNATIVFLGDNVYCCGLPDSAASSRAFAESRLNAQLDAVAGFQGEVIFVPGNHDWGGDSIQRVDLVTRQEQYVENYSSDNIKFLPDNGLPGPVDVKLADGLRLIIIDSQWWMTDAEKHYGSTNGVDIEEDADLILELRDLMEMHRKDDLVIAAHHPVKSNGRHGGFFSLRDHLFPLTAIDESLFLPLPIVGSLYPIVRRMAGGAQDFSHPRYKSYRQFMEALFQGHEGRLIHASGHEHSLQVFSDPLLPHHHLVSGAGSKADFVAAGRAARFTSASQGLMRIQYFSTGEMWLEAWESSKSDSEDKLLYRIQLEEPANRALAEPVPEGEFEYKVIPPDSTVRIAADKNMAAGALHRFFFGSLHREAWTTDIDIPVFDIGTEHGGLVAIKRGGSLQTTSVRLRNEAGHQFVLRSVSKDPTRSLPPSLRETIAKDLLVDQYSMLHPYAAVVVPRLANAAGVYHANPRVVHVPSDPRFGPYQDLVADQIMIFEERPDEDMSHAPSYGRAKNVIGTVSMLSEIRSDNDHRIDAAFFARARIFDLYISDWDRHSDQWRWGVFSEEDGSGARYRAIPRDRDWAMGKMNGVFPTIAKSRYVLRKHQDFRESYGFIEGLVRNGGPLDRRVLISLTRGEFRTIAEDIQRSMTDEVIDAALSDFPDDIQAIQSDEFRQVFHVRRDKLPAAAEEFYEIINRFADVVGSDKHERFEVERISDDQTQVVMYKTSKEGEIRKELFRRIFHDSETTEIRLYGLGGNDTFVLIGDSRDGILVRAVGGTGADTFLDHSGSSARRGSFKVYDAPFQSEVQPGHATELNISDDPLVNRYDPYEYGYPHFMPALFIGRNQDDGLFIGGGGTFTRYSFRKKPFDRQHAIRANLAARTGAFNISYEGRFSDRVGEWDLGLSADVRTPNNIRNYYGLGNETENSSSDAEFYQARFAEAVAAIRLIRPIAGLAELSFGSIVEYTDVDRDSLRFVGTTQSGVSSTSFSNQTFLGFEGDIEVDSRDSGVYPTQGFTWHSGFHLRLGLHEKSDHFGELNTQFSFYLTPVSQQRHTLAARVGVEHRIGDFPFYRASTLGGKFNLRGWRSTRFAGRTAFYQSIELRSSLFKFSSALAVGSGGLLAFVDNGRVWTDDESSSTWHQGYGVGLWANFFDLSVLRTSLNFSEEETTLIVGLGLFF